MRAPELMAIAAGIAERDAARKAQGEMRMEAVRSADTIAAMRGELARVRAEAEACIKFTRWTAKQKTVAEFDADDPNRSADDQDIDYEGAYDAIVEEARKTLKGTHDAN